MPYNSAFAENLLRLNATVFSSRNTVTSTNRRWLRASLSLDTQTHESDIATALRIERTVKGMTAGADRILRTIASEIRARTEQVKVAIDLFDEGATVPFVARHRKEATGGLDDTQLRQLEERLVYLRELEARRAAILDGIRSQGILD